MTPERELTALLTPIYEQAHATARRLCASWADGDDLFQEAVIRALQKLDTLRDAERFQPWFFAIMLSLHRSRWRRHFWRRFLPLDGQSVGEPVGDDGGVWEETRQRTRRMAAALATLPPAQREAVVLFEVSGFTLEETAAMQRVSVATVKSRLFRGRDRLRRHYRALGFRDVSESRTRESHKGAEAEAPGVT